MRYLLLLTCALVIAAPSMSHAQIGSLLKKKITEATKKPDDPAPSTPKPATPATAQPVNDPNLIPITETSLTALEHGLETEIALRAAYKKELADQAARQQKYQECTTQLTLSPESLAIAERSAKLFDGAKTNEDLMAVTAKIAKEREELTTKRCGQDPGNPAAKQERLNDIARKAAAAAGPIQ